MTRSLASFLHECAGKEEKKGLLEEDARMTPTASRASSQVKRMLDGRFQRPKERNSISRLKRTKI